MSKQKHTEDEMNAQTQQQSAQEQAARQTQNQQETVSDAQDEYLAPEEAAKEEKKEDKTEYYLNLARQVQADFDNYRKRNAGVYSNALIDGKVDTVKAFLSVIDNFDRALAAEPDKESSLYKGIAMIRTQIDEALSALGVEEIGKAGEPFNPEYHNAVMQAPAQGEQKPGEIAEVFVKGFKIGDRVIRHTMVKVTE